MFSINIKKIKDCWRYTIKPKFTRSYFKWTVWPKIIYWYKYKLRWPLMLKRTFDKRKLEIDKWFQHRLNERDQENQKEKEALNKLIKGLELVKIKIEYAGKGNYLGGRYRVAIDIDPHFVEHTFIHGDDQYAIDILCRELTFEIGTELRRINFKRECYDAKNREYQKKMKPLSERKYLEDEHGNRYWQ